MTVEIEFKNNQMYVHTPYNREFISESHMYNGKFNASEKAWVFDVRDEQNIRQVLFKIFGTDGSPAELCTARITVVRELEAENESIILGGRVIARATDRDSGARPGDGIVFINKKPQSGGSVKYWKTIIEPGTVFEIRDIPAAVVEMLRNNDRLETELVNDTSASVSETERKIAALTAQREQIDQQIRELQSQL